MALLESALERKGTGRFPWGSRYGVLHADKILLYKSQKMAKKGTVELEIPISEIKAVAGDDSKKDSRLVITVDDGTELVYRLKTAKIREEWLSKVSHLLPKPAAAPAPAAAGAAAEGGAAVGAATASEAAPAGATAEVQVEGEKIEGYANYKSQDKSSWNKKYFVLNADGVLKIYSSEKMKKVIGEFTFTDHAINSFFRPLDDEEEASLKKPKTQCFLIMAGFKEPGQEFTRCGFHVNPIHPEKKATDADADALCQQWTLELSKRLTMGEAPAAVASTSTGSRILVDPAFKKGAFSVPARFEWHGTAEEMRELMGVDGSPELEVTLMYMRKVLVGRNEDAGWKTLPAQPVSNGAVSFAAECVLPASRGYQSRWVVRQKPDPSHPRGPNVVKLKVVGGKNLLAVNGEKVMSKEKTTANPSIEIAHYTNNAKTSTVKNTLNPTWEDAEFLLPLRINPLNTPPVQEAELNEILGKPMTILVTSRGTRNKFMGYAEVILAQVEKGKPFSVKLGNTPRDKDDGYEPSEKELAADALERGEIELIADWEYDDTMDPNWVSLLTPLHRAPNLLEFLRPKIPLVGMMCAALPRDQWEIRNLPTGGSRVKQRLKESLIDLEDFLPYNTWDVLASTSSLQGGFVGGRYTASVTEKGLRAAEEQKNDPNNQYMMRSQALGAPFKAVKKGLFVAAKVDLDAIFPDPLALFIPKNTEPNLDKLKEECEKDPTRELKTLNMSDEINIKHPEEEGGPVLTLASYEQIRDAVSSKRPLVVESFRLPVSIEWVPHKKDQELTSLTFFFAAARIRPPPEESSSRKRTAMANKAKGAAGGLKDKASSIIPGKKKEKEKEAAAAAAAAEEEEEEEEDVDGEIPEWIPTLEQLAEVCKQSPFVKDVFLHRSEGDLPITTAVVVPEEAAVMKWAAENKVSCTDFAKLCTSNRTRYAVADDLIEWAKGGVLSGEGIEVEGEGRWKIGAKDKQVIQSWDFVRAVHLEPEAWADASGLEGKYAAVLEDLRAEAVVETSCLVEEWNVLEVPAPAEGTCWQTMAKVPAGPMAYKWKANAGFFFERGSPFPVVQGGSAPTPEDDHTYKITNVVLTTPFGIGVDVGV